MATSPTLTIRLDLAALIADLHALIDALEATQRQLEANDGK